MLNVQNNFGGKSQCPLCKLNDDEQSHLIDCIIIKLACPEILENKSNCSYEDIFSNDLENMNNIAILTMHLFQRNLRGPSNLSFEESQFHV